MALRPAFLISPAAAAALLLSSALSGVAPASRAATRGQPPLGMVALAGTVPAAVASERPLGPLPGSRQLSLQVDLPLRHFSQLQASIAGLSDPRSVYFQRFLAPAQLTARYGPTKAQLDVVESYLRSAGIAITSVSPQRNMINATATARVADRAFGVRIWRWREPDGVVAYGPRADVVLPASVARDVLAVSGLDDFARPEPQTATCTTKPVGRAPAGACAEPAGVKNFGYSPSQLRRAYGLNRLASSSLCGKKRCDGAGQHIGILEFGTSWDPADESAFDSKYGLNVPSPSSTAFCYPKSPCPVNVVYSDVIEADLDVEVAHAIAPGARLLVFEDADGSAPDFPVQLGNVLNTMLNAKAMATTNSISYGTCESDFTTTQALGIHQEFALLAKRGEVFFAASGDHGRYCHNGSKDVTGPLYPASDPLVTAVGGTNLLLNKNNSYAFEYAWSESGGGSSTFSWNTRPSWQTGPGVPAGKHRLVPDVSADGFCSLAAGCATARGHDYDITGRGTKYPKAQLGYSTRTYCSEQSRCWAATGETSAATPLWAAVAAVYNQYAESAGRIPLNANVNEQLYTLAFHPHLHAGAITDVTYKAENSPDLYQNAGKGWDGSTGAGSPQAYVMAADLPGLAISPKTGAAGSTIILTGTAFRPGERVKVADVTGGPSALCSAKAAANGQFTCTSKIPAAAGPGFQRIVATGATSKAQADTRFKVRITWSAAEAPLPADARANPSATLQSVACPSASACVAVGYYNGATYGEGLLETQSGPTWSPATAPLPGDAAAQPEVYLYSVACPATSSCVAAGNYTATSGSTPALLETLAGATWTPTEAPLPSNASGQGGILSSVACPAMSSCAAVGVYFTSSSPTGEAGLLETLSGGAWTAASAPLPAGSGSGSGMSGLACPSSSACVAVGGYLDAAGHGQGLLETLSGGAWTPAPAPLPPNAAANPNAYLSSITCSSVTSCVAAGSYSDSSGNMQGLLDVLSGTAWTSVEAPLPARSSTNPQPSLTSAACATSPYCAAVGTYLDASGHMQGLLESLSGTTWAPAKAPLPADASSDPSADLFSAACPGPSACVAAGDYLNTPETARALLEFLTGTQWSPLEAPLPAGADLTGSDLATVTCASPSACVAVGGYWDSSGNHQALVVTGPS